MKFLFNALSNIINGSANAIFALVLPPLLITKMSLEEYALWSYCLQTGALIGYLNLGVQTAVGRYVALYKEKNDNESILNVIRTADRILYLMFFIGILASIMLSLNIQYLVKISQQDLVLLAPDVILIVSIGYCVSLLLNSYAGYFVGIRANHVPMWINLLSKVILGFLIVIFVEKGLFFLSLIFLIVNLLAYFLSYIYWRRQNVASLISKLRHYSDSMQFIKFCLGLSVWNLGMLLVTGMNSTIVGYYSFSDVAYFTIANGLVMALIGFVSTGLNPLIQVFTGMHANNKSKNIAAVIVHLNNVLSFLMLLFFIMYHSVNDFIFTNWLTSEYVGPVSDFVNLLIISACVRVLNVPYALSLIATGNQSKALLGALIEGSSNFILALILCSLWGVGYLPLAMIISSIIGTLYNVFVNMSLMKNDIPLYKLDLLSFQPVCLLFGILFFYINPIVSYGLLSVSFISFFYTYKGFDFSIVKVKTEKEV
ncbi:hypothetical protein [Shewanella baltica]|uniref:hypothetical protein n=1 Tax=Shewanella baltica TaxID=62322 RepID=UPI003D7B380B